MESIGNVIKTRTFLLVKNLKIAKHRNPCEFFFCLIGAKYTAYFDGIIWDNELDEEIAKLSGVACGFFGIGIYLLPPFVWPMISTPQSTIKKSCEASFQSPD